MGLSRRERREQRKKLLKEQIFSQQSQVQAATKHEHSSKHKGLLRIYDKHYMLLEIIPLLLLVAAIVGMVVQVATTGDFINKGVSLKGGVVISIPVSSPVSIPEIEKILKESFPQDDIEVRSTDEFGVQQAVIITTDNTASDSKILDAVSGLIPDAKLHASSEITGASLGGGFFKQTMMAMIIAFIFMAIVVFISFKTFVPSMAVIICAFADILETMVFVNLIGLKISTAGIAAFLMLIGYSVDTDILLTTRVLRGKEGTVFDRSISAAKTGMLMTTTTIVAVIISLLVTQSATIKEIMTIMLVGLIFDIINTWLQNTAILRHYMDHKKAKQSGFKREIEPEIIDIDEGGSN
jgi:preprotein translocase subunit SecF